MVNIYGYRQLICRWDRGSSCSRLCNTTLVFLPVVPASQPLSQTPLSRFALFFYMCCQFEIGAVKRGLSLNRAIVTRLLIRFGGVETHTFEFTHIYTLAQASLDGLLNHDNLCIAFVLLHSLSAHRGENVLASSILNAACPFSCCYHYHVADVAHILVLTCSSERLHIVHGDFVL